MGRAGNSRVLCIPRLNEASVGCQWGLRPGASLRKVFGFPGVGWPAGVLPRSDPEEKVSGRDAREASQERGMGTTLARPRSEVREEAKLRAGTKALRPRKVRLASMEPVA